MKRFLPLVLIFALLLCVPVRADELTLDAPSALLMEKQTGTVLFAKDEHTPREPASVTKVMTLLLTMEAIDSGALSYDDTVTGSAHAASMGGSQIWLKEGEQMRVEDLIKAVCVVSGNDAAVALGEHLAGSEEAFVARMNERAKELGMNDTHFVNCTGLPADGHVTSAYDIALMSRELIWRHPDIRRFTTIWMTRCAAGRPCSSTPTSSCAFTPARRDSRPARPIRPNTASAQPRRRTAWSSSQSFWAAARATSAFLTPRHF